MFTRCPECHTVYPITADDLTAGMGQVSCSNCKNSFDALTVLFDQWPEPEQQSDATLAEQKPVELSIDPLTTDTGLTEAVVFAGDDEDGSKQAGRGWRYAIAVLLIVTLIHVIWLFWKPLLEIPSFRSMAVRAGLVAETSESPMRDPERIYLVSRDMHVHPGIDDALVLSATIINRAEFAQPYPILEVTLLDAGQNPIARRLFKPGEYLNQETDPNNKLDPNVLLPILLELTLSDMQAAGYEIAFR